MKACAQKGDKKMKGIISTVSTVHRKGAYIG